MMVRKVLNAILPLVLLIFFAAALQAQCETWNESPRKEEGENAHSNYRSALKVKDYELAFSEWQTAYKIAPAADGKRDFHFTDGIKLYMQKYEEATDEAKKEEYKEQILKLYDEVIECYLNQAIELSACNGDQECYNKKAAYFYGRKGFDMFYTFNSPYEANLEAFEKAIELGDANVEYTVLEPMASIITFLYQKDKIDAEKARDVHETLVEIADFNIENNEDYSVYYESSKARMLAKYAEIESDIFDCDYFKSKLKPKYEENPNDPDLVKYVYNKLLQQGCPKDDPFVLSIKDTYEKYAEAENARLQEEFEKKNPAVVANRMYKEGNFEEAIDYYNKALEVEESADKRAQFYFNIASIQGRKMGDLQRAISNARKAMELKDNWGQPLILIGDIYAKASRSCSSDAFEQRLVILAALAKYRAAKSIDPSLEQEANRKLGIYRGSIPTKDDAFMRGYKEGQQVKIPCWIGETVTLQVQ